MNESILKALMRLFAIIANVNKEGVSPRARTIVESYLRLQLNQELIDEYLELFDEYLGVHHKEGQSDGQKAKKRTSLNSVKVLMICHEINEELQQKDKIIVLLRLLEFAGEDEIITEKELEFIKTVAETFNINEAEYKDIKAFVSGLETDIVSKDRVLIVDNNLMQQDELDELEEENQTSENQIVYKHIYERNFSGRILMLHISSTNTFLFRYKGDETLYLNSHNIIPSRSYVFDHGALIKGPKFTPIYYSDVVSKFIHSDSQSRILLTAKDIEFKFKNSENGIHKFNFNEESGHLIGVMGGSGVGKSTLLSLLIGNMKLNSGQISINGYDLHKDRKELEGVIGYVPQDDLLIEELTVFQNLYFNAKLCFSGFSKRKILKTVAKVLVDLELNEIRHLKVGDPLNKFISGGQRKRLNIALELMREPSIMVVDEPTSGLSSADSEMVMSLLKEQTLKGKLVIVNIHQPSSDIYKLFDKILVLDRGGYPVYFGNPIDAIVYFKTISNHVNAVESDCPTCGNVNPEQVLEILEAKMVNEYGKFTRNRKITPKEWYTHYIEKIDSKLPARDPNKKLKLPQNFFKVPNWFTQFKIFLIRAILSKLTDKQYLLINFLEAPALAIILGYFSKYISGTATNPNAYLLSENENIPAYLFMCVIVALFMGLSVSAEEIIRDRKILKREAFLNLSKFSYINSKVLMMFFISAIQTLSFILVGNYILGVKGMLLDYWLILFTTSAMANLVGLNISAALNSVVTIYITIPFILVPQLLFSGVIVNFNKLHKNFSSVEYVPAVGDLMTSRWAYEALAVTQFKRNDYEKHFFDVEKRISDANFVSMYLIPELQSRINESKKNLENEKATDQLKNDIQLIKNEINYLSQISNKSFNKKDEIVYEKYKTQLINEIFIYLEEVKLIYDKLQYKASEEKDKIFSALVTKLGSKEAVFELRENFHNKRLAESVQNKNDIRKILEYNKRLIQVKDPIFMTPHSNFGRAHFYAPEKKLFGLTIDTLWFNVLFIWFTSTILYFILLFDLLRKLIEYLGNIKIRRKGAGSE